YDLRLQNTDQLYGYRHRQKCAGKSGDRLYDICRKNNDKKQYCFHSFKVSFCSLIMFRIYSLICMYFLVYLALSLFTPPISYVKSVSNSLTILPGRLDITMILVARASASSTSWVIINTVFCV